MITPIQKLEENLYIKREDLIPFSFGGNKARKARLFFKEIDAGDYDCVVTYGSCSSNHCRVVANECCRRAINCYIISPKETDAITFNRKMMGLFGADITMVPVSDVHNTIERKLSELRKAGKRPYFIPGGGHGNIGTQAYVDCYEEIGAYELENNIHFDYIFLASGTGTTQAGLVCGQLMHNDDRKIVGISIARKNPRGREVVLDSIRSYMSYTKISISEESVQAATVFLDDYTTGYGKKDTQVINTIEQALKTYGIPLDATYTGKAFWGMKKYIEKKQIKKSNILFIHTGGAPLFFDDLKEA